MMPRTLLICALAALVGPISSSAHHSFAAEFIQEVITIEGVVAEVWFKSPHVRYYVEVTNENGEVELWDTRAGSTPNLIRSGWTRDSIQVGDQVTMTGNRGRDGRKLLNIGVVNMPDGKTLPPEESGGTPTNVAGVN